MLVRIDRIIWAVTALVTTHSARDLIARNDFAGDQAELNTHFPAMEYILAAAETSGVNADFPRVVRDLTARAIAAGHGPHEIAALIEVLRRPTS